MIFPINKKHTFFSKEKTLLTFFFILFISFSAFGQQDKKLILHFDFTLEHKIGRASCRERV